MLRMRTEHISDESLQAAALDLLASVEEEGQITFKPISPPNGWSLVDQEHNSAYRIKAVNPDMRLFSKVFSSKAVPYVTALHQVYQELATLALRTPVLKPIGLEKSVLFFPLAKFKEGGSLQSYLTDEQIQLTRDTILRHELVPIAPGQRVDVVEVDGKRYLVDVVEDSDGLVYPFLNKSRESIE